MPEPYRAESHHEYVGCAHPGRLSRSDLRWGELRRTVQGISEKMLAQTLRILEKDGFVLRTAQPTVPPRVDYSLTPRGREVTERLLPLMGWIAENADEIIA